MLADIKGNPCDVMSEAAQRLRFVLWLLDEMGNYEEGFDVGGYDSVVVEEILEDVVETLLAASRKGDEKGGA